MRDGKIVAAVTGMDHGHINGMTEGIGEAGAVIKWAYDPDTEKTKTFLNHFQKFQVKEAKNLEQILEDPEVDLVLSACIPSQRADLGIRVMEAGKDYFVDKAPFTTLEQLERIRKAIDKTRRKYMVYYSERLHSEAGVYAGKLVKDGVIGDVVQVMGMGPHRLNPETRPDWFFHKATYGGILCDIGSHQIEQFLYYSGCENARVVNSQVGNYCHSQYPEMEDFGEVSLVGENGASNYFRVDWLTPDGLSTWGDGRTFILGTKGYIELRKYVDVARDQTKDHVYWVDEKGEHREDVSGKVGYPFFQELLHDCIDRTETAMTQEHALKAGELCVIAQISAQKIK